MSSYIRAEIGTTGEFVRLRLTGTLAIDVAAAVEHEHPCEDTAACDIAVALREEFPLTAGYLLSGATETPLLDAVYQHYDADPHDASSAEYPGWLTYGQTHSRECRACNGYTFADDKWRIETCGHCGQDITVELSDFDAFTTSYATTALWAETDPDTEEPLDRNFTLADLSQETRREVCEDCDNFRAELQRDGWTMLDPKDVAHNFWLTRNRHGAGFWDGAYGSAGEPLTKLAKAYGECTLYVGDDGRIHTA